MQKPKQAMPPALQDVELAASKQSAEVNTIVAKFTADFAISDAQEADTAVADLQVIKSAANKLDKIRKSFTRPLDDMKKRFMDLFRLAESELKNAEAIAKRALLAYQTEEQRKAEEDERKARAQAEAARKAEEERLRQEAEAAALVGDVEAVQAASEAAEALDAMPVAAPVAEAPKLDGVSTQKQWRGRVHDMNALMKHIVETGNFGNLVILNQPALTQLARSTKGTLNIPGIEFYAEEIISVRS